MARTYRTLDEINPDLFRSIILGTNSPAIEEESTRGLMSSRFATKPRPRPVDLDTQQDTSASPEASFLKAFAEGVARNTDNPQRVAESIVPQPRPTDVDLSQYDAWMSMPPAPGQDQTRNALGEAPEVTPEFEETASRLTRDLMRDFDLSETQAAAIVGNLAVESANFQTLQEIDPLVEGSRGGYGYAQWTGDRRVAFERWAEENGLDPSSYEANYGYLKKELSETDDTIGNIGRNTIDRLREMTDLNQATSFVMEYYLRPGVEHEGRRQASAQQILGLMARQD